ncbi:hypothetical protein [Phenylobacterium sp. J367]|uniref:hypothetical protein n=1 Tax=Phenylobacterium sp. J367 TaxID=2898435 RepID=UPI002150B743|nr:hypothetical protein [Phenylobacterium sp. J367]MCR5878790.1 hypothetical protein [Phenylobacterium sp. J367]
MRSLRVRLVLAAAVGLALTAQPALAQSKAQRAQALQKLSDCRKVADSAERLACYDTAAEALETAEAKGDVVVVDREQAREVRKQAFGFQMPSLSLFEKGEKPEDLDSLTGEVAAARMTSAGKWIVELKDGAVWAQIDANEVPFAPKPGDPVRIRKASLGSYMLSVKNQRSFRASRQQ